MTDPPLPVQKPSGAPSQKSMTRAERRDLQDKQRAAKQAAQAGKQGGQPGRGQQQQGAPVTPKPKPPQTPQKKVFVVEASGSRQHASSSRDMAAAGATDAPSVPHGLRIFSHFGQPKVVGHVVKGDIHPEIVRLGLLFSEFKISGANARCIATLSAFKKVPSNHYMGIVLRRTNPFVVVGHSRLHDTSTEYPFAPSYDPPVTPDQPFSRRSTNVCNNGKCDPRTQARD